MAEAAINAATADPTNPDAANLERLASGLAEGGNGAAPLGKRTGFRLLVVDDDDAIRELAAEILDGAGYKVMTAGDGVEALRVMTSFRPDLVITDLRMPRMSGFELLKVMRARFPQLPVIAVSGEFNGDALPPGVLADVFLPKDCYTTPHLRTTIEELLAAGPLRAALPIATTDDHVTGYAMDADARSVLGRLAATPRPEPALGLGEIAGAVAPEPSAFATSFE